MSFINPPDEEKRTEFKRTKFLKLTEDAVTSIRVLQDTAHEVFYHYINRAYVECPGDSCPVCALNREIYMEDPKNYGRNPDYHSRGRRYFVNVLDKTPAKKCPNCGTFSKNPFLQFCPKCNSSIASVEVLPINEVRVLGKGPSVFNQLNDLDSTVTDESGNVVGITNFGINIKTSGSGLDTITTVIPNPFDNEPVELNEDQQLYDLENAILKLTNEEILELLEGVSVRDILFARNGDSGSVQKEAVVSSKIVSVDEVTPEDTAFADVRQKVAREVNSILSNL